MMMAERNSRYPFTASQWQELAHQALIFKYMASGQPIPSELILPIRRSFLLDSTTTASPIPTFPHQPNAGWGCFQVGFGRKAEDPEPGRCRRTDGKKWRCSKEAYPDSKYCERHMHRGKNRSRKHVEMSLTQNPSNPNPTTNASPYASPLYPLPMAASETQDLVYPFSSSSRSPGFGFSPQNHLNTGSSSSADRDYRYLHGLKENVDEYSLFSDASGVERDGSWRFTQLGMSSLSDSKQRNCSSLQQNNYSHFTTDLQKQEEKQQHCFVLGADFKLQRPVKVERDQESDKPVRRFFDDWPLKSKDSWVDLEEDRSNWASFSKTQLSISIPMAHHEFPIASSQSHRSN